MTGHLYNTSIGKVVRTHECDLAFGGHTLVFGRKSDFGPFWPMTETHHQPIPKCLSGVRSDMDMWKDLEHTRE